jgi:acetylornithine/N-succinyldiaminopimelate aminotransferase
MNQRQLFLQHIGQTSPEPLAIEVVKAQDVWLWDAGGKQYLDLIAGISVCNVGHCHPKVVEAVQQQAAQYMHTLVYGEMVQSPQVQYAKLLTDYLPPSLNTVFFTNSGTEAAEGAMKLAKRATGRMQIIAFKNSYHGSTQGALSLMGDEYWRNAFRPLLPGVLHLDYNELADLNHITSETACVFAETIQAESGINPPSKEWIQRLRKKCDETGALLVFDEIQAGFGRTGWLWAFEPFEVVPDILLLGKALGGGMPLGAFIANQNLMQLLTTQPVLGHISTFGGHPVSCAAGLAAFKVLLEGDYLQQVKSKEALFRSLLQHPRIREIRSAGLWMGVDLHDFTNNKKVVDACISSGMITDWFLFAPHCLRIAPPLTIEEKEIHLACSIIKDGLDNL